MSVTISGGISINGISFILPPSATYGWYGGGYGGDTPLSTAVNRITYATDTATASTRGPLSFGQIRQASTGNSNYGWYAGGNAGPGSGVTSNINLITYATDTATAVNTGLIAPGSEFLAAAGTAYYGWFGAGYDSLVSLTSSISRIDYAVTTATASIRGPLSVAKGYLSASSDYGTYGWFIGGKNNLASERLSTVDRITYSNDTATAQVRGPLSASKYGTASAGNTVYGWVTGGSLQGYPTAQGITTVERITYANDTATASVRGPLITRRFFHSGTGNIYYGWFGGGYTSTVLLSSVNRIDYSNDTVTATARGGIGRIIYQGSASANT